MEFLVKRVDAVFYKYNQLINTILTVCYPDLKIQALSQARSALSTSGLYFSVQNNKQLVLYKDKHCTLC